MSADNWAACPKCKRDNETRSETAIEKAKKQYGKVDPDEYIRLIQEAEAIEPDEPEQTLREDYEQGTDEDGEYMVSYSCSCNKCGFAFRFKHTQDVFAKQEKK